MASSSRISFFVASFAILKRGVFGTFHSVSEQKLFERQPSAQRRIWGG